MFSCVPTILYWSLFHLGFKTLPRNGLWLSACPVGAPSGRIHCCTVGSSMAAWDLLCVASTGCRGTASSSTGLSWAARGFCSAHGSPPALTLLAARLLLPRFSPLSPSCCCATVFSSLNLLLQSTLSIAHASALAAVGLFWSSWSWLWSHMGQLLSSACRGHFWSLLTPPCWISPAHHVYPWGAVSKTK